MNKLWLFMMLLGSIILLITNPSVTITTMMDAGATSLQLCIELCAIYAIWLGLFEILEQTGLSEKLAKLLNPLIKKLFPSSNPEVRKYIALNMSANLLGLGNAATPSGIKAMKGLEDGSAIANFSMIMLMVINATSIQLFPTTTISLRANAGSTSPADIILPTIIVSLISFASGIALVFLFSKIFKRIQKKHDK